MELKINKEQYLQLLDCMSSRCGKFKSCEDCNILYLCHRVCGINNPIDKLLEVKEQYGI